MRTKTKSKTDLIARPTICSPSNKKGRKKKYGWEAIKSAFVCSDYTIEEFSKKYELSTSQLQYHAENGDWFELQERNRKSASEIVDDLITNQIETALDVELTLQALKIEQTKDYMKYLLRYRQEHGDLFMRAKDTNEISLDQHGMPMLLRLPSSPNQQLERKGQHELIQGLSKLLKDRKLLVAQTEEDAPADMEKTATKMLEAARSDVVDEDE